jgi:hypothetical protein
MIARCARRSGRAAHRARCPRQLFSTPCCQKGHIIALGPKKGTRLPVVGRGGLQLAIYRLLQNSPFGPDEIARMTSAYEDALLVLGLVDRDDPLTEIVARKIIEIAQTGERDPVRIRTLALVDIGTPKD